MTKELKITEANGKKSMESHGFSFEEMAGMFLHYQQVVMNELMRTEKTSVVNYELIQQIAQMKTKNKAYNKAIDDVCKILAG